MFSCWKIKASVKWSGIIGNICSKAKRLQRILMPVKLKVCSGLQAPKNPLLKCHTVVNLPPPSLQTLRSSTIHQYTNLNLLFLGLYVAEVGMSCHSFCNNLSLHCRSNMTEHVTPGKLLLSVKNKFGNEYSKEGGTSSLLDKQSIYENNYDPSFHQSQGYCRGYENVGETNCTARPPEGINRICYCAGLGGSYLRAFSNHK